MTASPHLPLTLDDDASPHEGMWPTVVPLRPHCPEGARKRLPLAQTSELNNSVVRRRGVLMLSLLIHLTFVPRLMVMLAGLNLKPWIRTVLVGCFCALAVGCLCAPEAETTNKVLTTTSVAVINNIMRLISVTSSYFSRPKRRIAHNGSIRGQATQPLNAWCELGSEDLSGRNYYALSPACTRSPRERNRLSSWSTWTPSLTTVNRLQDGCGRRPRSQA